MRYASACRRLSSVPGLRGTKSFLDASPHQPEVPKYDLPKGKSPTHDLGHKPLGTYTMLTTESILSSVWGNKSAYPQMTTRGSCKCSPHWDQKRNLTEGSQGQQPHRIPSARLPRAPRPAGFLFSQYGGFKQQNPQEPVWGTSPLCPSVFLGAPSLPDQLVHSQDSW